ncbi:cell division control protein 6 homolog isoform X2 [Cotesia glomerata]|uniref:cell division control protein 6 homolog isoform X2 n=1 Tax=Cotesia glomerata TaxID=32391 RepID=UPI001D02A829|nr:cell division control protein 6 homolog isoform X2 [Cotesia glomerata]
MSIQATIKFPSVKKLTFYGGKNEEKQDFTNATVRNTPSSVRYVSKVKKIMTISSSESDGDSDCSDSENSKKRTQGSKVVAAKTITRTSRRRRQISISNEEDVISPPKQRKPESPKTPSTLLNKLILTSPTSKRNHLAPKKLFAEKYQSARKALHSSVPENLPGRESQLLELRNFIKQHLENETSGSLYISGPPGTGKTASLSKIMLEPEFKSAFKIIYVNCTTMKSAGTIYTKILQELKVPAPKSEKAGKAAIEKYLRSSHKTVLLVLDEIDQLESKRQSVLYSVFEWPSIPNSNLLLVGIANALDLTDRILPRLNARCELKPKLMHFAPYTKEQIVNIIAERLREANVADVFTGVAMHMLAAKVAAISGDVRRALDISRRVVELAESQRNSVLKPSVDNCNNGGSPKKENVEEKPVDLKDVIAVLNGVYGGSQNIQQEDEEDTFPLQQKLLLCSLMLILNKGRNKDVTISKLHEVYKKVCKKRNIHTVDISEFVGVCSLIETRGILRLVGKKEPRLSKVSLQWDQNELEAALQDKKMMAEIINDTTCL